MNKGERKEKVVLDTVFSYFEKCRGGAVLDT